jgi:hypothetical protein
MADSGVILNDSRRTSDTDVGNVALSLGESSAVDNRSKFGICSICRRDIQIKKDGLIRIHGPVKKRCQGSDQPPATSPNTQSS